MMGSKLFQGELGETTKGDRRGDDPEPGKNPTSSCIDSGAGEGVCPVEVSPDYETHHTEKVGNLYRAAGAGVEKRGREEAAIQDECNPDGDDFFRRRPTSGSPSRRHQRSQRKGIALRSTMKAR